jgi:hypothetical protein
MPKSQYVEGMANKAEGRDIIFDTDIKIVKSMTAIREAMRQKKKVYL